MNELNKITKVNLIYVHIGKFIPKYIYDSIYQTILVSPNIKIYIILNDENIEIVKNMINKFNINIYLINVKIEIEYIALSTLELPEIYLNFIKKLSKEAIEFRDGFWISTTARFFYINCVIKKYNLIDIFHIENDVMLYENLNNIKSNIDSNYMYMVRDSKERVVPSIIYIPKYEYINNFINYVLQEMINHKDNIFKNDMQLLASYQSEQVKYFSFRFEDIENYIMDGAAIGQYLGGIDLRNIEIYNSKNNIEKSLMQFNNSTIGFINKESEFNPKYFKYYKKPELLNHMLIPLRFYYCKNKEQLNKKINNLHIHSKQLYQFSSINNLKYNELISGDRILTLCDYIITIKDIIMYHKNLDNYINYNQLLILDSMNSNEIFFKLNNSIKKNIKLFIYTHILDLFITNILPILNKINKSFILYLHNSDHELKESQFNKINKYNNILKIYSQNIEFYNNKCQLLPIGIANSMFKHGDLISLYKTISNTYYQYKTKNLYININCTTYYYRKIILNEIKKRKNDFYISTNKPYIEYLKQLSEHKFCLCIRGNGLACHREWESLYLGTIPVIINNKYTNLSAYVKYLTDLNLPFYEINDDNLDKYSDEFFNEQLYQDIIKKTNSSIFNNPALKLNYYNYN